MLPDPRTPLSVANSLVCRLWHRRTAVCILALLMLCGSVHAAEITPGMELELKLLEYRQQLDHGKVVFKVETLEKKKSQVGPADRGQYEIEFDGKQIRSEFQTEVFPIEPDRRILTSNQIIVMSHDSSSILDLDQVVSSGSLDVLNPILLGAAQGPVAMLDNWTLEERLAYPDRSNETVTDEVLDGIPVRHISYDRSIGNRFDIWIAPSMGHAILKRVVTSENGSVATMSCDYAEYPPGVWFPSRVEQQRTSAEGELVRHEIAKIESADFGYRPDDLRFSLLSLDLPVGKSVNDNGIRKVWNGRELETPGENRVRQVQEVKQQQNAAWWPYAAAGLAMVAVVVVVWRWRAAVGIVALLALCGSLHAAEMTPGMELEQKVIDYRRQITHGKVVFTLETLIVEEEQTSSTQNGRFEIEFDGESIRREFTPEGPSSRTHTTILTSRELIDVRKDPVRILDRGAATRGFLDDVFHPHLLGVWGPVTILDQLALESAFLFADRRHEEVVDARIGEILAKRVSYERTVGSRIDTWISPAQGYSIVRRIVTDPDGVPGESIEANYKLYPPGIWYPAQITYTDFESDGRVLRRELVTVKDADFSTRPPAHRFTFASLQLPVGTRVLHQGKIRLWNGERLETPGENRVRQVEEIKAATRGNSWWLYVAAGLASCATILMLAWRRSAS